MLGVTDTYLYPNVEPIAAVGASSSSVSPIHRPSVFDRPALSQRLLASPHNENSTAGDTMCLNDSDFTPLVEGPGGADGATTCGEVNSFYTSTYGNDCSTLEYLQGANFWSGLCCDGQPGACPSQFVFLGMVENARRTIFFGGKWEGAARHFSSPVTIASLDGEDFSSFEVALPFFCSNFLDPWCGSVSYGAVAEAQEARSYLLGRLLCLDHIAGDEPAGECYGYWSKVPVPDGFDYSYDPAWQAFSVQKDGSVYWTLLAGALVVADSVLEQTHDVECDNELFGSQEECISYCTVVLHTVMEIAAYEPCVESCISTCPQ